MVEGQGASLGLLKVLKVFKIVGGYQILQNVTARRMMKAKDKLDPCFKTRMKLDA